MEIIGKYERESDSPHKNKKKYLMFTKDPK